MERIRQLQVEWMQAWLERDADALENILHPLFTLRSITTDTPVDRASWLRACLSGRIAGTGFDYDEMHVSVSGDTAICDNRLTFTATIDGRDWSKTAYQTDVWCRDEGVWRVIRRHSSPPVGRLGEQQA